MSDRIHRQLRRLRRRRRGWISVTLLLVMAALLGCLALALDLAMVIHAHQQMRAGCEAGALAGAAELMDPTPLFPQSAGKGPSRSNQWQTPATSFPWQVRMWRSRQAVLNFSGQNFVARRPLRLDDNETNAPQGDIVIGWVEDPTRLADPLIPFDEAQRANSVLVRAHRTRARSNPLTLYFGRFVGVPSTDLIAAARATVDQRVYGFRPVGDCDVPVVPLLAIPNGISRSWLKGGRAVWPDLASYDNFQIDAPRDRVKQGRDGIPELVFRVCYRTDRHGRRHSVGNARWLLLPDCRGLGDLREQTQNGYQSKHLEALKGELALNREGCLRLPLALDREIQPLGPLGDTLLRIKGRKRVWPWGKVVKNEHGKWDYELCGFAAGRVVDCYNEGVDCLTIVVQPCQLQTCTALVRDGQPRNPWLGKLVLNR